MKLLGIVGWITGLRRSVSNRRTVALFAAGTSMLVLVFVLALLLPPHVSYAEKGGNGKGGGGGEPPPPVLPNVRYEIEPLLVMEQYTSTNEMNSLGMVVGWVSNSGQSGDLHGFMYDYDGTKMEYNFDEIAWLTSQLTDQLDETWHFGPARGINDWGDIVGTAEDALGNRTGYLIKTYLSPAPEDWTVQVLPDLGSNDSLAYDINNNGVVLGVSVQPEDILDAYLYDTWSPPGPLNPPMLLGLDLLWGRDPVLNDCNQVAGVQTGLTAFLFTPGAPLDVFDEAIFREVNGLNNDGVFSGAIRNNGKVKRVAVRYDTNSGELEPIITGAPVTWGYINEDNDVLAADFGSGSYGANYLEQTELGLLNLHDLIDENDPLRDVWINTWHKITHLGNRDDWNDPAEATGFGRLVGYIGFSDSQIGVVMTPVNVAP